MYSKQPRFKSNKPCHFFLERGFCKKGQDCEYSHTIGPQGSVGDNQRGNGFGGSNSQQQRFPSSSGQGGLQISEAPTQISPLPSFLGIVAQSTSLQPVLSALSLPLRQIMAFEHMVLCLPENFAFVFVYDLQKADFFPQHVMLGPMINEEITVIRKFAFTASGQNREGLAVAYNKRNLFTGRRVSGVLFKRVLDLKDFSSDIDMDISDKGAVHILEVSSEFMIAVAYDQTNNTEDYIICNLKQDWGEESSQILESMQQSRMKGTFKDKVASVSIKNSLICFGFTNKTIVITDLRTTASNTVLLTQVFAAPLFVSKFSLNGMLSISLDGYIAITQDEKHISQVHIKQEVLDCQIVLSVTETLHVMGVLTPYELKLYMLMDSSVSLIGTVSISPLTQNTSKHQKAQHPRFSMFRVDGRVFLVVGKPDGMLDFYSFQF